MSTNPPSDAVQPEIVTPDYVRILSRHVTVDLPSFYSENEERAARAEVDKLLNLFLAAIRTTNKYPGVIVEANGD